MLSLSFLILIYAGALLKELVNCEESDCKRDVVGLIESKGYKAESHEVITEDGYILTVQRIPYGKGQDPFKWRTPILLQHGLEAEASNWVSNSANQSLAFILADAGYDVWLGNIRGNLYSLQHEVLNPKMSLFWKFSWTQMAKYDLPAMVEYIKLKTFHSQIYYAGHSQGTLIGFAQFSRNPEFAKSIKTFFALAPVAHVGHITSGIKYLAPFANDIQLFYKLVGEDQFFPSSGFIADWLKFTCDENHANWEKLCQSLVFLMFGNNVNNLNQTRIPVYLCHNPGGTSVQNMVHFAQMVNTNTMKDYDYGSAAKNYIYYGQENPPTYDLSKLSVPTVLFHGGEDNLADPTDVQWLQQQLNRISPKVVVGDVYVANYTHIDFIWATNAKQFIYDPLLQYMEAKERETTKFA